MNLGDVKALARKRRRRARYDGNVAAPRQREDAARIAGGRVDANIAGDRREAENVEGRRRQRMQNRDRVVDAGIGVDHGPDDCIAHHACPAAASMRAISALNSPATCSASRMTFLRSSVFTSRSRISHAPATITSRTSTGIAENTSVA